MTDVSRYDDHHGGAGCPEPVVPAGLADLLAHLAGPPDFWDRPHGDLGPLTSLHGLTAEERAHANSLYRLGSKALGRGELSSAADWLGAAAEAGHPGAMFRLAALAARAEGTSLEDVRFLVAEAARHGHGDAQVLLDAIRSGHLLPVRAAREDTKFFDEVCQGLHLPLLPQQTAGRDQVVPREQAAACLGRQAQPAGPRLVLVPAPGLGRLTRARRRRETPGPQPASAAACPSKVRPGPGTPSGAEGLLLPLPPGAPRLAPQAPVNDGGERDPWWSANALRPAVLTEMARSTPARTDSPQQWKAVARALDILYLIDEADGITTRGVTSRSGLSLAAVTWLLHWLRGQHMVTTVAGAHYPGPLMQMTRRPEQRAELLQQTLNGLRDQLGAAVYVSSYTGGEVNVFQAASSPQAPAVEEWVDFRDAAHASAVGKSLLAQLDFDGRMNHLARYQPIKLTDRTITSPRALFEALDGFGPHAAQFDLLEYSHLEVCAAFPLGIPGRATCVALSLPVGQRRRLLPAARALSERSAGLLLALLLTDGTAAGHRPARPTTSQGASHTALAGTARALPRLQASRC